MSADRRAWRSESGSSAVEFALVAPLFIVLLFAIFQLGWAMHCAASVQWSLERASRLLVLDRNATAGQIQAAMAQNLAGIAPTSYSVTMQTTTVGGVDVVRLTSSYRHELVVPLLPAWTVTFAAGTVVPLR